MNSFRSVVTTCEGRLTASEESLVQEILASPTEAALLTATELSGRVGVHPATVVRLAQKLGFEGYLELRATLRADIIPFSEPARRVQQRLAQTEGGMVLEALVQSEQEALAALPKHVSQDELDRAAHLLIKAEHVYLFAQGHATSLADLMDRRLRRSGFRTVDLRFRRRDLAEHLLTLSEQDVVLCFSFHQQPPGLVPVLKYAREVKAKTVLVSDLTGALVRPQPDLVLAAPRGYEEAFQTLTVPMTICNALVLSVAKLDNGRSVEALERLGLLLSHFEGDTGNPSKP